MARNTRTLAFHPGTADSPIRRAFHEGLNAMKYKAPDGLAMDEQEDDARDGKTHAARNLDAWMQRAFVSGVPCFGEHGAAQMADRFRAAILEMWGESAAMEVQAASEAESDCDAALDRLQAKAQYGLSRAELTQGLALADEMTHRAAVLRDAYRARLAEMDDASRIARGRLTGSAA